MGATWDLFHGQNLARLGAGSPFAALRVPRESPGERPGWPGGWPGGWSESSAGGSGSPGSLELQLDFRLDFLRCPPSDVNVSSDSRPDFSDLRFGPLGVRLAASSEERQAAQHLRYRVFFQEQGAGLARGRFLRACYFPQKETRPDPSALGRPSLPESRTSSSGGEALQETGAVSRLDIDTYDAISDHLVVCDATRDEAIVGTYRVLRSEVLEQLADRPRVYAAEREYDLTRLRARGVSLMEMGRACVDHVYRSKPVLDLLWRGLARYVFHYDIHAFFGRASFMGTDRRKIDEALSYLNAHHRAAEDVCPTARPSYRIALEASVPPGQDPTPTTQIWRSLPPLVRGYLRVGARVGDGAVLDEEFGSIDICMVAFREKTEARYYQRYAERPRET